jgi:cobalt-zinc-cadmium efflux system protein
MAHDHRHAHHHHHSVSAETDRRALTLALALLLGFSLAEVVAGVVSGSVALLADAGHVASDGAALALALIALRLAARPPKGALTYGLKRAEPASALVNGVVLGVLGAVFGIEALRRLFDPPEVEAELVLVVALVAIPINLLATWIMSRADRTSVNIEGAFQHVVTDLYAFIATAIAAVVILATGFDRADPIAAIVVSALMLRSCVSLLRASVPIFLEAAPQGIDVDAVGRALAAHPGVAEIHDLHVWELTSGFPALSAHIVVRTHDDCHDRRHELEALLHERFSIDHTTLQVEHEQGLLTIEPQR